MNNQVRDNALLGEILDELSVIDRRVAKGKNAYDASDELKDSNCNETHNPERAARRLE